MNPYLITDPTCISFSGGRTSAYMLYKVLEANNGLPEDAIVCFANTGKEEEATLKFVHDCEVNWNVPIHWVEYRDAEQKFEVVNYETASRHGEPFEAIINKREFLPNTMMRFCTQELKIFTIARYMKFLGYKDFETMVGIRADEPRRVAKVSANKYGKNEKTAPLAKDNVTQQIVWDFWNNNSFDLGLAKVSGASNCDLCFLKGSKILAGLVRENPSRADWWIKMENKIGARFSKDKPTYQQMKSFNESQSSMFNDETIPCFCGD